MLVKEKQGFFKVLFLSILLIIVIAVAVFLGLYYTGKVIPQGKFTAVNKLTETFDNNSYITVSGFRISKDKKDSGLGIVEFVNNTLANKKYTYRIFKNDEYKYDLKGLVVDCTFTAYLSKYETDDIVANYKLEKDYVVIDDVKTKNEKTKIESAKSEARNVKNIFSTLTFKYTNKDKKEIITILPGNGENTSAIGIYGTKFQKQK